MNNTKASREPLVHITKRDTMPTLQAWGIRIAAVVIAIAVSSLFVWFITDTDPIALFNTFIKGNFSTQRKIFILLKDTAMLLGISIALTPAFKMRFWNTGAEGQVLIGALASVAVMFYLGDSLSNAVTLIIMLIASIVASAIWAGLPAYFKAKWNTNETLFTLMMNYVAMQLVKVCIYAWVPNGSMVLSQVNMSSKIGWIPDVLGQKYIINIAVVLLITVIMYFYLRKSKQGYEISVVGESENTARYIGINVKRVIIRTVLISGALCGLMGFLYTAGLNHTINSDTVGGNGFTAIMVSWLAKFDPFVMIGVSFLISFLRNGSGELATNLGLNESLGDVVTGIIILFIIGSEFFIRYSINFKKKRAEVPNND